jgi:hypothetical protein
MTLKGMVRAELSRLVQRYGYELMDRASLYEWQRPSDTPLRSEGPTDPYLTESNPRLLELRQRYAGFDPTVTTADLWTADYVSGDRLRYFRGHDAYLWQRIGPNMNEFGYVLATYYVRSIDTLGLMSRVTDDTWFGNFTLTIDSMTVSRDMLDSIMELYFLEKHLHLSSMQGVRILDVGAGYGRLGHRTCETIPGVADYVCVDAVAQSTFISEFYLKFRKSRACVVALDEIDARLKTWTPDLAVNVHSFSECRLEAIDWWLALLARHRVRYLMIVPNDPWEDGRGTLITNDRQDFSALIAKRGYTLVAHEPKYRDPVVHRYAINPTHYYLFELISPRSTV